MVIVMYILWAYSDEVTENIEQFFLFLGRLKSCATSRTVPGSIPGDVTGISVIYFIPTKPWALGLTQPLMKMSTRNIPGGKGGRCVRQTTYHHTVPLS